MSSPTSDRRPKPAAPGAFDLLTKLAVPLLAVVAYIVAEVKDRQVSRWGLLVLAFLSLAGGYYPSFKAFLVRRRKARRDKRTVRHWTPEFRRFVSRVGGFLNIAAGRNDTLDAVVLDICRRNQSEVEKLNLVPPDLFQSMWLHLSSRLQRHNPSLADLLSAVSELNALLNHYCRHYVCPAFERFAESARLNPTDDANRRLIAFRERFLGFLDDYTEFLARLKDSPGELQVGSSYFPRPRSI